ncbi:MAG: hypothetical protein ACHQJ6_08625 [Candidatus Berkiellales bacterium]
MVDTRFMQKKYSLDELVSHYLDDIKALKPQIKTPADENKLQQYYQAASAFKNVSIKDMVQFALTFGRATSGKAAQMRAAFPTLLGNRVANPTVIDVAYAQLLLAYTQEFKPSRVNLKEWLLRFVLSSRFSPLTTFLDQAIDHVITDTERNIVAYQAHV